LKSEVSQPFGLEQAVDFSILEIRQTLGIHLCPRNRYHTRSHPLILIGSFILYLQSCSSLIFTCLAQKFYLFY